jgi:hypothetical protein
MKRRKRKRRKMRRKRKRKRKRWVPSPLTSLAQPDLTPRSRNVTSRQERASQKKFLSNIKNLFFYFSKMLSRMLLTPSPTRNLRLATQLSATSSLFSKIRQSSPPLLLSYLNSFFFLCITFPKNRPF